MIRYWLGIIAWIAGGSALLAHERPRLVVVVSVDQLCYEYLERYHANYAPEGLFRRVETGGASYTQCFHRHALTITGPGHAALLTGAYAAQHGLIDNNWYDRASRKMVYCVEDPAYPVVGALGDSELKGVSPKRLDATTVGDVLKETTHGQAKVFGVTIKDRAAVLMAGHKADAVYWYDNTSGCWLTSRYYQLQLPNYLRRLNKVQAVDRFAGQPWDLLLPRDRYRLHYPDDSLFEESFEGLGRAFPHQLRNKVDKTFYKQLQATPQGSEFVLEVARLVIDGEQMGLDGTPDLLVVGLSSNDFVGHAFGPHSLEVEDMTYRTDRMLGEFVQFLDQKVGAARWTLILTADHAVTPIPEYAQTLGLPARRFPLGTPEEFVDRMELALCEQLGPPPGQLTYVEKADYSQVFLRPQAVDGDRTRFQQLQQATRDYLASQPYISVAITRTELENPRPIPQPLDQIYPQLIAPGSTLEQLIRNSFHVERSGDVTYIMQPYQLQTKLRASHGSPWRFDSHVPLLLLGCGIQPGQYDRPCSPASIASTIARLLDIPAPNKNVEPPAHEALAQPR